MRSSLPHAPPLRRLADAIDRLQATPRPEGGEPLRTGWPGPDGATGGLRRGAIHEWLGDCPPLGVLAHLAARGAPGAVLWVGEACRPYPPALAPGVRARSLFVEARGAGERVWAADVALRSGAASVVIADGAGLDLAASRRLQLAAGAGGAVGLLARPWGERDVLSAAWTRWRVSDAPTASPGWAIELLRCKGVRPAEEGARRWRVQRDHETGDVRVVPDAGDRPAAPGRAPARALA